MGSCGVGEGGGVEDEGGGGRCETGNHGRLLSRDPSRTDFGFNSIPQSDGFDPWEYGAKGVQNETANLARDVDFTNAMSTMMANS